jgi:putative tricarboxylic transport membrane protein
MAEAERPQRDTPGAIGSAGLVALGITALVLSADFSDLGAVFPRAIGGLMVALGSLYLVLFALGRTRRGAAPDGSNLRRAGVAVVLLGWAFALVPLGFLASSAIAFVLLLMLANHDRWTLRTVLLYGGAGALLLLGLYALFKLALLVPLP